jgi:hypothetical protein
MNMYIGDRNNHRVQKFLKLWNLSKKQTSYE